jgi:uncharacterized protein YbaR (Trm112 family)
MKRTLLQLIEADQLGVACPVCNGASLYWDKETQDVDVCDDCDRLNEYFRSLQEAKSKDNVIRLYRNPDTGKLDDIPF